MHSAKIHYIHLVAGEIGGVGKSLFCKMLIEAFRSLKLQYRIIDCDETTPNVGRTYDPNNYDPAKIAEHHKLVSAVEKELQPLIQAVADAEQKVIEAPDLEKEAQAAYDRTDDAKDLDALISAQSDVKVADKILEAAITNLARAKEEKMPAPLLPRIYFIGETADEQELPNKMLTLVQEDDLIVNLPAQVSKTVNRWIQDSDLLEGVKEDGIETICWFVAKPTKPSIEQLKDLHNFHKGNLKIVLVKNNYTGHGGNWDDILDFSTKAFLKSANIRTIEMENLRLADDARKVIDGQYPILSELVEEGDTRVPYDVRKKLSKYLRVMTDTIIATGLLPPENESTPAHQDSPKDVKVGKTTKGKPPTITPAAPESDNQEPKND